jgi:UDP:flavonoid glycosyltransferase YjiC (YdhE family)
MKGTIEDLIHNPSYKEHATKIGNTLHDAGGAKKAVDEILQFLKNSTS